MRLKIKTRYWDKTDQELREDTISKINQTTIISLIAILTLALKLHIITYILIAIVLLQVIMMNISYKKWRKEKK